MPVSHLPRSVNLHQRPIDIYQLKWNLDPLHASFTIPPPGRSCIPSPSLIRLSPCDCDQWRGFDYHLLLLGHVRCSPGHFNIFSITHWPRMSLARRFAWPRLFATTETHVDFSTSTLFCNPVPKNLLNFGGILKREFTHMRSILVPVIPT